MIPRVRLLGAYCGRHLLMTEFGVFTMNQPVRVTVLRVGPRELNHDPLSKVLIDSID